MPRGDALRNDPQANPPHGQARQPTEPGAGEEAAIIAADADRQAVFRERALEAMAGVHQRARGQGLTPQYESTERITHRERITVVAIASAELTFEIGGPHVIGRAGARQRRARCGGDRRPPFSRPHQSARLQVITDRRPGRPGDLRLPPPQHTEELLRAPARMPSAARDHRLHDLGRRRVRTVLRPSRAILETGHAVRLVSRAPLVRRLLTYAVLGDELCHRQQSTLVLADQFKTLLHRLQLAPRHRGTSGAPSRRRKVSPMSPD